MTPTRHPRSQASAIAAAAAVCFIGVIQARQLPLSAWDSSCLLLTGVMDGWQLHSLGHGQLAQPTGGCVGGGGRGAGGYGSMAAEWTLAPYSTACSDVDQPPLNSPLFFVAT
jgi:hypothetical protein